MRKCASGCAVSPQFTTVTANVYCDMNTTGGGWIVLLRNRQGSEIDFVGDWVDYENGFGDLETDFWYGLRKMHCLTAQGQWEMRVDYKAQNGVWNYLHYNQFKVANATDKYRLTVGGYTGKAGDFFTKRDQPPANNQFTTRDNDNNPLSSTNCERNLGGWWFNGCYDINPTRQPPVYNHPHLAALIEMKIRPKNCIAG